MANQDQVQQLADELRRKDYEAEARQTLKRRRMMGMFTEQGKRSAEKRAARLEERSREFRPLYEQQYGADVAAKLNPSLHYELLPVGRSFVAYSSSRNAAEAVQVVMRITGERFQLKQGGRERQLLERAPSLLAVDPSPEELRELVLRELSKRSLR